MAHDDEFHDRLAAQSLGVHVDASPTVVKYRFRQLVKTVHPDAAVADGCVDLGRFAEAKDRLLDRSERRQTHGPAAAFRTSWSDDRNVGTAVDVSA